MELRWLSLEERAELSDLLLLLERTESLVELLFNFDLSFLRLLLDYLDLLLYLLKFPEDYFDALLYLDEPVNYALDSDSLLL